MTLKLELGTDMKYFEKENDHMKTNLLIKIKIIVVL